MLARSLLPWCVATISMCVFGARAANAACVISGVRPTVPLPTMDAGQQFSFLATADCETLRFRVPGTRFIKIPKAAPDTGARPRTYRVAVTESEWDSLIDDGDTTFTWSIIGTTSTGVTTRVTTTNALKDAAGVTIDLSMADAKLVGETDSDAACIVSGAGDVDGDGHDDLLVGAGGNDDGGSGNAGAAYVVLGPVTGTLDLSMADAKLLGEEAGDNAGGVEGGGVAGAGDVDGDGNDDMLVGAYGNDEGGDWAGAGYLVLGPVTGALDLSAADAKLVGAGSYAYAGYRVARAGDVDGDSHADVLVDGGGDVHLVLGPVTGTRSLSLADAKLVGVWRGTGAGDVDADGYGDLLLSDPYNDEAAEEGGAAFLMLGPLTGTVDLSLAQAKLVGEAAYDYVGTGLSGAGDVDGDGHDDLLIGAHGDNEGGSDAGAAYLVLGPVTGIVDASLVDAKLVGEGGGDWAGMDVSGAGDVDGDGHDDLLVGAVGNTEGGSNAGAAYVVMGPATGTVDLSRADAKLVGEARDDWAGFSVSSAGDLDADGNADVFVGAQGNDEGAPSAGAAYVLYGGGL